MSDTTTITAEERARLRAIAAKPNHLSHREGIHAALNNLLDALEQSEGQLAVALQVNAKSQASAAANMLNAMMAGITGQKETVHVQVDGFQYPYCNEISKTLEAATAHDAICPKHPAVMRAEKAEAMVDWLADKLETNVACPRGDLDLECPFGTSPGSERCAAITYSLPNKEAWGYCWKEAARRAVDESEVKG